MKNPLLTIVMFLVFIIHSFSQVEDRTITKMDGEYFQGRQYRTASEIKSILANTPSSSSEYHKFIVRKRLGITTLIGGGVMSIIGMGMLMVTVTENVYGAMTYQETPPVQGDGLFIAGSCAMITGVVMLVSNPHFKRSINLYNSSVKGVGSKPITLNLTVNPCGLGMRMTF